MRRIVSGIGKALVTAGLLILLFVGYQLWGTGVYTARAQDQAERDFTTALDAVRVTPTSFPGVTSPTNAPTPSTTLPAPAPPSTAERDVVAHLVIPKIGVDAYVMQGTDDSALRKGPGHYPATPLPGQRGNAAIAGHRTTYGAPFSDLDALQVGDTMQVTTLQGSFEYRVYDSLVVAPDQAQVLDPDPTRPATITLTTCNPKYSASQRLVVKGALVIPEGAQPLASTVDPADPVVKDALDQDPLSGNSGSTTPVVIAGVVLALIGSAWWFAFHRRPRWTTWFIGVVPFAIALSVFYYFLERALPANY
ncbi:MAG: class E sortase [Actinomycetota bacterium]